MGLISLYKLICTKSKRAEVAKYTVRLYFEGGEEGETGAGFFFHLLCYSVYIEFGSNFIASAVLLTKLNVRHQIFLRQKIEVFLLLSVHLLYGTHS